MSTERIQQIRQHLDDIEWYTPTVPLSWEKYHSIIRELCDLIETNQNKQTVSHWMQELKGMEDERKRQDISGRSDEVV